MMPIVHFSWWLYGTTRKIKCVEVCLFHFFKQCIIVGLQSTGEASTLEQLDEAGGELTDFVSTAKWVLTVSCH